MDPPGVRSEDARRASPTATCCCRRFGRASAISCGQARPQLRRAIMDRADAFAAAAAAAAGRRRTQMAPVVSAFNFAAVILSDATDVALFSSLFERVFHFFEPFFWKAIILVFSLNWLEIRLPTVSTNDGRLISVPPCCFHACHV